MQPKSSPQDHLNLKSSIIDVVDHPSPGVVFRDISPMISDGGRFDYILTRLVEWAAPLRPDVLAAVDARGFIFGGALAAALKCGFVPLRKKGKLPRARLSVEFDSEYSTETLEVHTDAFAPGTRVLFHDDVIAVGNCSSGSIELLERLGAEVVGACFLVELKRLGGRDKLAGREVFSVVQYD
jgi:adenine phosphoribosyltransferase